MRLLDTKTGQFVEHNPRTIIYAILSHTWDQYPKREQTFQELTEIQQCYGPDGFSLPAAPSTLTSSASSHSSPRNLCSPHRSSIWHDPRLSPNVRRAYETARRDGFRYIWIDSCCIDKTSSSELSEAINSMYLWYRDANMCYAFLADVPSGPSVLDRFSSSRWFTRGWTLQELIAPYEVVFLSAEWESFGTKHGLADRLEEITNIDKAVLEHLLEPDHISVAKRMSWASRRETTRVEDQAYSLLGIFDINMPTLYGEGPRAFRRLQEEILRRIPDQSLFAWGNTDAVIPLMSAMDISRRDLRHSAKANEMGLPPLLSGDLQQSRNSTSLFATSPHDFLHAGRIESVDHFGDHFDLLHRWDLPVQEYTLSPYGVRTHFLLLHLSNRSPLFEPFDPASPHWYIAILACAHRHRNVPRLLGRLCASSGLVTHEHSVHLLEAGYVAVNDGSSACSCLFSLPYPEELERHGFLHHIHLHTVYLDYPDRPRRPLWGVRIMDLRDFQDTTSIRVHFPDWGGDCLRSQGYRVEVLARTNDDPDGAKVTLTQGDHVIHISYQYWVNAHLEPIGGLMFVAYVYVWHPSDPQPLSASVSRERAVARKHVFRNVVTLLAARGLRYRDEVVRIPLTGGKVVKLRVALSLVSAACYHFQIMDESPKPKDSSRSLASEAESYSSDPESEDKSAALESGDDEPWVLRV